MRALLSLSIAVYHYVEADADFPEKLAEYEDKLLDSLADAWRAYVPILDGLTGG